MWHLCADVTALEQFRSRVKALLDARQMTQTQLAAALGISRGWLSDMLGGKSDLGKLSRLDDFARALGVTVIDLFGESDQTRHTWKVQGVHQLLAGAPHEPTAREAYVRELFEAFDTINKTIFTLAVEGLERQNAPTRRKPPDGPRRRGKNRR
jgi:transcriptional regulator with XRE-family HTH domain